MRTILLSGVCLLLALCGCSPKPGPPVSIVSVRLTDMTAFETTATFKLRFSNDTPEAMQLTGGAHKIYLNGLYVGEGLSDKTLELPRLATATQEVTVHLSNIALVTRIKPIIDSKSFDYRIRSTLYSQAGRLRSENAGRLELKDFIPEEKEAATATNNQVAPATRRRRNLRVKPGLEFEPAAHVEEAGELAPRAVGAAIGCRVRIAVEEFAVTGADTGEDPAHAAAVLVATDKAVFLVRGHVPDDELPELRVGPLVPGRDEREGLLRVGAEGGGLVDGVFEREGGDHAVGHH